MFLIKTVIAFLRDPDYREILVTTSIVIIVGTVFYHYQEGWRWLDSLYFSIITLTTIGYGDFSPKTDAGKIFTLFILLLGWAWYFLFSIFYTITLMM